MNGLHADAQSLAQDLSYVNKWFKKASGDFTGFGILYVDQVESAAETARDFAEMMGRYEERSVGVTGIIDGIKHYSGDFTPTSFRERMERIRNESGDEINQLNDRAGKLTGTINPVYVTDTGKEFPPNSDKLRTGLCEGDFKIDYIEYGEFGQSVQQFEDRALEQLLDDIVDYDAPFETQTPAEQAMMLARQVEEEIGPLLDDDSKTHPGWPGSFLTP